VIIVAGNYQLERRFPTPLDVLVAACIAALVAPSLGLFAAWQAGLLAEFDKSTRRAILRLLVRGWAAGFLLLALRFYLAEGQLPFGVHLLALAFNAAVFAPLLLLFAAWKRGWLSGDSTHNHPSAR
jgi:hypothetical protein